LAENVQNIDESMTIEELQAEILSTSSDGVLTAVDAASLVKPRIHILLGSIAASLMIAIAIAFRLESISIINLHLLSLALQCAIPIGSAAAYCHWAGYRSLRDSCLMVAWSCLFVNLLPLPSYAAARTGLPLIDSALVRSDHWLGVDSGAIVAFVRHHPPLESLSISAYSLMPVLMIAATLLPAAFGRLRATQELLIATIAATLVANVIQAIFPADGPWNSFHFQPYWNESLYSKTLAELRAPGAFTANADYTSGLITFPSFHVGLAVLSAYALRSFRWLRIPAIVTVCLIAIATVTTGWHYATDGIAGAALAAGCIRLARKFFVAEVDAAKITEAEYEESASAAV